MPDLAAARDLARHLAEQEPRWQNEQSLFQIREGGTDYFVLPALDAGRLEALRDLCLALFPKAPNERST